MAVLRVVKPYEEDKPRIVEVQMDKKLISVREFAREYGIGVNKAYTLANKQGFPCIKNGRNVLVIRHLIDKWLEDNVGLEF